MPEPLLLQAAGEMNFVVPETTGTQRALALLITGLALVAYLIGKWRYQVWGLSDEEKQRRETVRKQKLRQTPAMLQVPSTALREGAINLQARLDALFDTNPAETHTKVRGAIGEVYRAVSVAWAGRVESVPKLARRTGWLAIGVAITGAIAVSTGAVVAALRDEPGRLTLAQVLQKAQAGLEAGVDVVGVFPYGGAVWSLVYAYTILAAQWVYEHWVAVVAVLVALTALVAYLDHRVDAADLPDRIVPHRRLTAAGVFGSAVTVWAVGAGVAVGGGVIGGGWPVPAAIFAVITAATLGVAALGYRSREVLIGWLAAAAAFGAAAAAGTSWPKVLGLVLAAETALVLLAWGLPRMVSAVRADLEQIAGAEARLAGVYLLTQRVANAVSVGALILIVLYTLVALVEGKLLRVLQALAAAPPSLQAAVGAVVVGIGAALAYLLADSWGDIYAALQAAVAQKAVRAKLAAVAMPWLSFVGGYIVAYALSQRIVISAVVAVAVALLTRGVIALATEATYRADWQGIAQRLARPEPIFFGCRAYTLSVDAEAGKTFEYYLIEVNREQFLGTDRQQVVADAAAYTQARANNEDPPATDSEWFAEFVIDSGIVDPDDWHEKLDEKIREHALTTLRRGEGVLSDGGRVTRETWDRALSEFDDGRVQRRVHERDLRQCISIGSEYVSLARDVYRETDDYDWPSLSD